MRSANDRGRAGGFIMRHATLVWWLALGLSASASLGQAGTPAPDEDLPGWTKRLALDPSTPAMQKYREQQRARAAADKALRKLRLAHFGNIGNEGLRQEGIVKLREYTNPALFPLMVDIFANEKADVRRALLDHFYDSASPEGDGSLAWLAMFSRNADTRDQAMKYVRQRIDSLGKVPDQVTLTIASAIKSDQDGPTRAGLDLIKGLDLVQFVPWLIAGQVRTQGVQTGSGDGGNGDLAYIVVGTQTAFVSDLTPVVSQSAVGFDPQLSTITTGTLLRVHQAVVYEYHTEINQALIDLTSRHMGYSTRQLGWDVPAWRDFYAKEFLPKLAEEKAAKAAAAAKLAEAPPADVNGAPGPIAPK